MPAIAFYNENGGRAYPFLDKLPAEASSMSSSSAAVLLPESIIVDFGCVMGVESGYNDSTDIVYLSEIRRDGTTYTFVFRTTCPTVDVPLIFTRDVVDGEYVISEDEAGGASSSSSSSGTCPQAPLWDGYLVTATLSPLPALIADGDTWEFVAGDYQIEPARIQNLSKSYVDQIGLANFDRTRAQTPSVCQSSESSSGGPDVIFVNANCLRGDIRLIEGYNCTIRQDSVTNTLSIAAGVGAGAGEPCEEVPLYDGDEPPEGSDLLTGGPSCNDIIKSVEGVVGPSLRILGGNGVVISVDEDDPHGIIVDVNLSDMAACRPDTGESSSSG